jgi:hypothetical protein
MNRFRRVPDPETNIAKHAPVMMACDQGPTLGGDSLPVNHGQSHRNPSPDAPWTSPGPVGLTMGDAAVNRPAGLVSSVRCRVASTAVVGAMRRD